MPLEVMVSVFSPTGHSVSQNSLDVNSQPRVRGLDTVAITMAMQPRTQALKSDRPKFKF